MKRGMLLLLALALVLATATATSSASAGHAKFPKLFPFQSPSGNIGCILSKRGVRCDIREHSWPTPPKPSSCDVDYGQGVAVDGHGRASYVCAGDTVLDPSSPTLGYGDRISKGRFRCASKTKGMRCVNRETKDGFFLSRDSVHLF
jgi:hypothetical protein